MKMINEAQAIELAKAYAPVGGKDAASEMSVDEWSRFRADATFLLTVQRRVGIELMSEQKVNRLIRALDPRRNVAA